MITTIAALGGLGCAGGADLFLLAVLLGSMEGRKGKVREGTRVALLLLSILGSTPQLCKAISCQLHIDIRKPCEFQWDL